MICATSVLVVFGTLTLLEHFRCCEEFASKRSLCFNPTKTQLIRFSIPDSIFLLYGLFTLCDHQLSFLDTVMHLRHLLHYNLSDVPDVNQKLCDMVKKANCLLASFPRVSPAILTHLFQTYCLPLYGSGPALYHIEVAFNKVLRRIWHLPSHCHTGIVARVAHNSGLTLSIGCIVHYCPSNTNHQEQIYALWVLAKTGQ